MLWSDFRYRGPGFKAYLIVFYYSISFIGLAPSGIFFYPNLMFARFPSNPFHLLINRYNLNTGILKTSFTKLEPFFTNLFCIYFFYEFNKWRWFSVRTALFAKMIIAFSNKPLSRFMWSLWTRPKVIILTEW